MGDDRIDWTSSVHKLGSDKLGTGTMLRFCSQREALIGCVVGVTIVIVMVDPSGQAVAEPIDERQGYLFK